MADLCLAVRAELAPNGVLRAGINLANQLLVSGSGDACGPSGIAPDLAAELAKRLGVAVSYASFKSPAEVADGVDDDRWDIALIGADPERAEKLAFTPAYVDIPATFLVPAGSPLSTIADVDKHGVRIASIAGAAFDLWLQRNMRRAELLRETTGAAAFELFKAGKADALAHIRQNLVGRAAEVPGSTVLKENFMIVQQAVAVPRSRSKGLPFIASCIEGAKASGFIAGLIEKHGATGGLLVSPAALDSPGSASTGAKKRKHATAGGGGKKVAVLGCGAMGCIYAALLADAGNEVWTVDVWKEHVTAMRERGLRVEGASGSRTVWVNATTEPGEVGTADIIIIATKASGVKAAAQTASRLLAEDGVILTIQNGLGAGERITQYVDPGKVMLGVASNFGAAMKGPGHAEHKSMNLICIGEMHGGMTERLEQVVEVWRTAGFKVQGSPDIHKMIWQKLICNCTYSGSCTVTGLTVGEVQDNPAAWSVALSCAREAYEVARAHGIALGFDDVEDYVRKFGATVRGAKPSMLQDRLAHRRSEIDVINGAIPVEAAKVGLQAPVNQTVSDLVRALESAF